ncbi:hypothetical protein [uncultured Kordia sp.]|uniref:hypothetical protein n=1 Tax=uncultured Kordia sp. TaxID=507699 RepID=UPI0026088E7C|nr:hypothetical protein [uncultured Kordia sp.]
MKKKRTVGLEIKKVSISKLNDIKGGDPVTSFDLPCAYSTICTQTDDDECKTFLTATDSIERC